MSDNEIIKALECCIKTQCENCCNCGSWHEQWNCMTDIMKKALDLINRQKAEIERLDIELRAMRGAANSYKLDNQRIRAEAIKEFADKVIGLIYEADDTNSVSEWQIRNLVKEMAEDHI